MRPLSSVLRTSLITIALCGATSLSAQIPESYYTAAPNTIINEMRQTPRPRANMPFAEVVELDKVVLPRAKTCERMFYDDPRMMERIKSWQPPQQNDLANECRRIIADSNAMQTYLAQGRQAEQEQARRKAEEEKRLAEEKRKKDEEARLAAQREAFLAQRPNFLLVLNAESSVFQVTKSLEGKAVITRSANAPSAPIRVDFIRASAQSSGLLLDRYARQPAMVISELRAAVAEAAKAQGLAVDTAGLEPKEIRTATASKCVGEAVPQREGGPAALTRVCSSLRIGLVDRAEMERIKPLIDAGRILVLAELLGTQLQALAEATAKKAADAQAAETQRNLQIISQLEARPTHFVAITFASNKKAASCALKGQGVAGYSWSAGGYASLADFSRSARLEPDYRFDEVVDNVEALWTQIQKGACSGAILTGAEMARLIPAVQREKLSFTMLPLRDKDELHPAYAKARGFESLSQLEFAAELKTNAARVKALAGFGITDQTGFRTASTRMTSSGYSKSTELEALLEFLGDEAEGVKSRRTAIQIRSARLAAEQARERERAEKLQRELPLYSIQLACAEPMGHLAETMVGHLARSPAAFIQIMSGSAGRFCSQLALPVADPNLITSARLIDRDAGGAEYYVTKAADGRSMLGLIKRRGG
jgi:hypothetical protein